MIALTLPQPSRATRPAPPARWVLVLGGVLVLALGGRLIAQIEGDRGIAAVVASQDIEVSGIAVEATGKTADEARANGWAMARKQAWAQLKGPAMPDGQLESLVKSIVIESEQIGPRRYIAKLGVVFDRARAGQWVGGGEGQAANRSAPMLTLPVLYEGGVAQLYEVRGPWQAAWAQFRPGGSAIDYVRPSGGGGDSLFVTAGQPSRRSRLWWRTVLDQFDAADVIMPMASLERQWPGGPVKGTFTARYGPDNKVLASFELTAPSDDKLPAMLAQSVIRMDRIYNAAFGAGALKPDTTLNTGVPTFDPALAAAIAAADRPAQTAAPMDTPSAAASTGAAPQVESYTVQFPSPDAATVDATVAAVRGAAGVRGAATTSLAMGGTSVLRVTFAGSSDELKAALTARGFSVSGGGSTLSIRR